MTRKLLDVLRAGLADRYKVIRPLGKGGMATVFLAKDKTTGNPVALKVLNRSVATRLMRERFHREMEVGGSLGHPNIVPIFTGGEVENMPFLVMPYLPEDSLRRRLDNAGPLDPAEAVAIGRQVADALGYAHGRGIIHRDIKPDNILFSEGRAVVTDFGVAVAIKASLDDRVTAPGEVLGTPTYMSPEQAMGRYQLDARTDIYSLGCVVFEMLVGAPPFPARWPDTTIVRRLADETPSVCARRPEVSTKLDAAVCRALEWKPEERFASAEEFRDALGAGDPR
jgi:serine/threonine protein kinase